MLVDRIARFIADPTADRFERLALEAFRFQYERILPLRRLCDSRGLAPAGVDSWQAVPPVPALAFKSLRLAAAPPRETFRSSGTTAGDSRSVHYHPFPDLYRATIDASFPPACLPYRERPPMLSLVPDRELAPDSSLGFMVDHVLARYGAPESVTAIGRRGVETAKARAWLAARQRAGRPIVLLATAFALADLLDALARVDLRFRLPAGSVVFETGGFKGRSRELARPEVLARLAERLAVTPQQVVREYGMTELTSQCYTAALSGGDPDLFVPPHWVRARVLDPETLDPLPPGQIGLVAIFDLANVGSAIHLLSEDLGVTEEGGFRLAGRAAGAELRGCSLAVEELGAGT